MIVQQPKKKPKKQTAKKSAKQVDISERRWLVLELRKQGASYRDIAEQLKEMYGKKGEHGITKKYDHSLAYIDFKAALKELNERNTDELEENRRLDLERLDAMFIPFFERAQQGDPIAADKASELIKMRAQWFGYNAPTKLEHTGANGGAIEVTTPALQQAAKELKEWRKSMTEQLSSLKPPPE